MSVSDVRVATGPRFQVQYVETLPQRENTDRSRATKGIVADRPFGGGDLEETGATGIPPKVSYS